MLLARFTRLRTQGSIIARSAYFRPRAQQLFVQKNIRKSCQSAHSANHDLLDSSEPIEEETSPYYRTEEYYPVRVGDVYQDRYKVIGKLGYGTTSTVWLCNDLDKRKEYVALKVCTNSPQVIRELPIYRHIRTLDSQHHGSENVRKLLDSFEIQGPHGAHTCLVLQALGMSLHQLRDLIDDEVEADAVRVFLREMLRGVHFLHEEAHVVHTDILPKNILMGILDNAAFERFEYAYSEEPITRKELPSRTVYPSGLVPFTKGSPSLCDLGAPEVILGMPWSYPVDVWGFAMTLLWDLFEPKRPFRPHSGDETYPEAHHLAQMVAVLGKPPVDFMSRSEKSQLYWDAEGNWKSEVPIPSHSLEATKKQLEGEEKRPFLLFRRKMLKWKPEDRCTVNDIFFDEWFVADVDETCGVD